MGTTRLPNRYQINGVLSTDKTVLQNIETLCAAAGSFLTYDIHTGQWAVVINQPGDSIASFDDSNIIGALSVSGTGLGELYNSVKVEFPHVDLNDQTDFIKITIPNEDRNPNEPDNQLNMAFDVINNPVQAEALGFIELKQNRIDKIVRFNTDFSQIGLNAGDIIDITNSVYNFVAKKFRITTIVENDSDDGGINLAITALEYDPDVYDDDFTRYLRETQNGITSIGNIATPATPTVAVFNTSVNPRIEISATVPSGVVNTMDLYLSQDSVNFTFVESRAGTNGNTFAVGDSVTYSYNGIRTGTAYAKVRATNGFTTSEFSPVGSAADINLLQALSPGTPRIANNGEEYKGPGSRFYFNNKPADEILFTGNATPKGMILAYNNVIWCVTPDIPPEDSLLDRCILQPFVPPCNWTLQITGSVISMDYDRAALGCKAGLAYYVSKATFDANVVQASGLNALAWSDWQAIGSWIDNAAATGNVAPESVLTGNVAVSAHGGQVFQMGNITEPTLVALGISTTRVPTWYNYAYNTVSPIDGANVLSFTVPFSTNTVFFEQVANTISSTGLFTTPGIVANTRSIQNMAQDFGSQITVLY
jgi:hypothetical protein